MLEVCCILVCFWKSLIKKNASKAGHLDWSDDPFSKLAPARSNPTESPSCIDIKSWLRRESYTTISSYIYLYFVLSGVFVTQIRRC